METRTRERLRERERMRERVSDGEESSGSPKKSKKGLIIAAIFLMLLANGVFIWFNMTKNETLLNEKNQVIEEQKVEMDKAKVELQNVVNELEAKKQELAKLGASTESITAELERVKANLRNQESYKGAYFKLKKDLDDMKQLSTQYEAEITQLKAQVDGLKVDNTDLKGKLTAAEKAKKEAEQLKSAAVTQVNQAAETIKGASALKAENIQTFTLSAKGKEREGDDYKVKDIDLLRVSFILPENKLAKTEGKEIILRIVEPDGGPLFDLASGGGSFMYSGKEVFYTQKQDILYDKKSQQVTFDYKRGHAYKPGNYTIEVYTEGTKIGHHSFKVQ